MPNLLLSSGATVESCIAAAKAAGLSLAGLQYGGQCFGGNALGRALAGESACNVPCTANTQEICGGSWTNSIYAVSSTAASPTGATIPPASQITDSKGTVWTVTNGYTFENGTADGGGNDGSGTGNINLLLYYNGVIYLNTTNNGWFSHGSGSWVSLVGDPRIPPIPSPNPSLSTTLPPQAAAAGFNTLVLNADFTSPAWSNPANYVTNCGAAASVPGQPSTWHFTSGSLFGAAGPCSRTSIVSDAGSPALQVQYLVSDYTQLGAVGGGDGGLLFPTIYTGQDVDWLPNEFYIKAVFRTDSKTQYQPGMQAPGHIVFWGTSNHDSPTWTDENFFEQQSYAPGQTWWPSLWEWYPPCGGSWGACIVTGNTITGLDFTTYHTVEALVTSDEMTATYECLWLDGVSQGCTYYGAFQDSANYIQHDRLVAWTIGTYNGTTTPVNDMTLWFKSIQIYSCQNFATQTCPGTMVQH